MRIRKTKTGVALVKEHEEDLNLASLAEELERITEQIRRLQERAQEIQAILDTAKGLKDGDEVEIPKGVRPGKGARYAPK